MQTFVIFYLNTTVKSPKLYTIIEQSIKQYNQQKVTDVYFKHKKISKGHYEIYNSYLVEANPLKGAAGTVKGSLINKTNSEVISKVRNNLKEKLQAYNQNKNPNSLQLQKPLQVYQEPITIETFLSEVPELNELKKSLEKTIYDRTELLSNQNKGLANQNQSLSNQNKYIYIITK